MRNISIVKVNTKNDLERFIRVPFVLYSDNEHWVAPLVFEQMKFFNRKKNPYFEHSEAQLFLATDGFHLYGRISAHTNVNHNKFHDDKKGFFGFFECINDQETANSLLSEAEKWLREKGCDVISGPFSFSTNDECGMLVEGFNTSPCVMMPYNHPYYPLLLEYNGFKKAMDLYAWLLSSNKMPEFLNSLAAKIEAKGQFTVRCLDKKNLKRDVEEVFTIYQKAWEKNWGFVPMTKREFDHLVKSLLPFVNPELVFIAECKGEPVGFSVALPDYNFVLKKLKGKLNILSLLKILYYRNKIDAVRVITMGVVHEYQGKGIDTLFYYHTLRNGLKNRIEKGEFSWVLETNTMMNKIAKHLGASLHKIYRIYEKEL